MRHSSLSAKRWSVARRFPRALRRRAVRRSPGVDRCPADKFTFRCAKCMQTCPFNCRMEILPSALCWRICVPAFIRIGTIRESGYFASVLELRPVSRCQASTNQSCCSSGSKSICNKGSADPGNRFHTSTFNPSPGRHALRSVAMINTFRLRQPISEESREGKNRESVDSRVHRRELLHGRDGGEMD